MFRGIPLNTFHAVTCRSLVDVSSLFFSSALLFDSSPSYFLFVALIICSFLRFDQGARAACLVVVVLLLSVASPLVLICFCVQDCIAARTSLEGRLAWLLLQNHELEEELAAWKLHGGPDPGLLATLGALDACLMLVLVGGVLWRQHYGPAGPVYPVDR